MSGSRPQNRHPLNGTVTLARSAAAARQDMLHRHRDFPNTMGPCFGDVKRIIHLATRTTILMLNEYKSISAIIYNPILHRVRHKFRAYFFDKRYLVVIFCWIHLNRIKWGLSNYLEFASCLLEDYPIILSLHPVCLFVVLLLMFY